MKGENTIMMFNKNLNFSWWALRVALGLAAFLAGLDKFLNLLTDWTKYLSPIAGILPVGGQTIMHLIGPVEMLVGLAILTRWTRIGAYAASAWLLAIAFNLVTTGTFFDVAVRDVVMAIAAFALARLTEARESLESARNSEPQIIIESALPAAAARISR
jgi:hypothetical protein